jgi:hypothetical protein
VVLLVLAPTIWQQSEDVLEFGHAPTRTLSLRFRVSAIFLSLKSTRSVSVSGKYLTFIFRLPKRAIEKSIARRFAILKQNHATVLAVGVAK